MMSSAAAAFFIYAEFGSGSPGTASIRARVEGPSPRARTRYPSMARAWEGDYATVCYMDHEGQVRDEDDR